MIGKRKMNTDCAQGGFTLIEVLVALFIFTIGILAAYTMQVRSMSTAGMANSVSVSATWATYLVEDLLNREYSDPLLENDAGNANGLVDIDDTDKAGDTPDGARFIRRDGTVGTTAVAGDLYSVFWNIADDAPLEGVKQIRIKVLKNDGLNQGELYAHDYYKSNENL